MKIARFTVQGEKRIHIGIVEGEIIREVKGDIFGEWTYTEELFQLAKVTLLAPLIPNQVIGIGKNFVSSEDELPDELPEIPVFFFKPVSSVIGPDEKIKLPPQHEQVKFEAELAVVIGKEAKDIEEKGVQDYIFGYTIGNDVTSAQHFHPDGHWTIGKAFDSFTPLGPAIETNLDLINVRVQAAHNGKLKQDSSITLMIISIPKMISYLSKVMTLQPGDVILTGSPIGAELLKVDDCIECMIEGIGVLRNSVMKVEK
ncbi:fumarylacetoacetate hydrolase family protein [Halalkalibacter kiskunsagensis]|uniref:Fumarylacetoacetate hydrolase family protein n=1 Tax=Halalkalibacter kiskunsagensis TaxID=1548599 RepID=A0ABV6KEI3_9BACI